MANRCDRVIGEKGEVTIPKHRRRKMPIRTFLELTALPLLTGGLAQRKRINGRNYRFVVQYNLLAIKGSLSPVPSDPPPIRGSRLFPGTCE